MDILIFMDTFIVIIVFVICSIGLKWIKIIFDLLIYKCYTYLGMIIP